MLLSLPAAGTRWRPEAPPPDKLIGAS